MRFERRLKANNTVDLTPLIDVVFQLVIFFMVSSVFKTAPGIPLDLPSSSSSEAVTVSELRIKVLGEDQIFVNFTSSTLGNLEQTIAKELSTKEYKQAILEANQDLPYRVIMGVMDALRNNNITDVGLISNPRGP